MSDKLRCQRCRRTSTVLSGQDARGRSRYRCGHCQYQWIPSIPDHEYVMMPPEKCASYCKERGKKWDCCLCGAVDRNYIRKRMQQAQEKREDHEKFMESLGNKEYDLN